MATKNSPYVVHKDGQSVLLPDGEVLAYLFDRFDHPEGVCVPCTLRYRHEHALGLDVSDLARLLNPPDDAEQRLEACEARAMELHKLHPLESPSFRTAVIEVDETKADPTHLFGTAIYVAFLYDRIFEEQLFYGHVAWVKRRVKKRQGGLRYWLYFKGQQLPLDTREQALEAIRTVGLPAGVMLPFAGHVESDEEVDALFVDVARRASFPKGGAPARR